MKYYGVLLAVKELDRSVKFYQELFGLEVIQDFGSNKTLTGGISLQSLETWTTFIEKKEEEILFRNHAAELYFETRDLEAFGELIATYPDVVKVQPPLEQRWGQRTIRIYDPDNHIIEVSEDMQIVVKRFLAQGMTQEEVAVRMDMPVDYVQFYLQ